MPEPARDLKQELFGRAEGPVVTPLGAVKEAFLAVAPGLKDLPSEGMGQLKHMADLGRSELANALFGNGAFVLYSHEPKNENFLQGQDGPEQQQNVQGQHLDGPEQQQDVQGQRHERGLSM